MSGVSGYSTATDRAATSSMSAGNSTAVLGYSGNSSVPAAAAKTGVFGYAAQDSNARGVLGKTTTGQGVRGEATSGYGTRGVVTSGVAASGYATTGTALLATSANPKIGSRCRPSARSGSTSRSGWQPSPLAPRAWS